MSSRVHHGPSIKPPDNEHTVRRTVNFERNYSSILSVKPPLSQLHPALNLVRFPPSSSPLSPIPLPPLDLSKEALMRGCRLRLHRSTCHFFPPSPKPPPPHPTPSAPHSTLPPLGGDIRARGDSCSSFSRGPDGRRPHRRSYLILSVSAALRSLSTLQLQAFYSADVWAKQWD